MFYALNRSCVFSSINIHSFKRRLCSVAIAHAYIHVHRYRVGLRWLVMLKKEARLSQRDCATLDVIEHFA